MNREYFLTDWPNNGSTELILKAVLPSYFIHKNSKQYGPYTIEDLGNMLETGSLLKNDLVWYEGIEDWTPLENLSLMQELQAIKNLSLVDVETNEQVSESNEVTVPQIAKKVSLNTKTQSKKTSNTNLILGLMIAAGLAVGVFLLMPYLTQEKAGQPVIDGEAALVELDKMDHKTQLKGQLPLRDFRAIPVSKSSAEKEFWDYIATFLKVPENATPLVKKMHKLQGNHPQAVPSTVTRNTAPISVKLVNAHREDFYKRHPWAEKANRLYFVEMECNHLYLNDIFKKAELNRYQLKSDIGKKKVKIDYWLYDYLRVCLIYDYLSIHGTEEEKFIAAKNLKAILYDGSYWQKLGYEANAKVEIPAVEQIFWPFINHYPELINRWWLTSICAPMLAYNRNEATEEVIPIAEFNLWALRNPNIEFKDENFPNLLKWKLRDFYTISGAYRMSFFHHHVHLKNEIHDAHHLSLALALLKMEFKEATSAEIVKYKKLRKKYLEVLKAAEASPPKTQE